MSEYSHSTASQISNFFKASLNQHGGAAGATRVVFVAGSLCPVLAESCEQVAKTRPQCDLSTAVAPQRGKVAASPSQKRKFTPKCHAGKGKLGSWV